MFASSIDSARVKSLAFDRSPASDTVCIDVDRGGVCRQYQTPVLSSLVPHQKKILVLTEAIVRTTPPNPPRRAQGKARQGNQINPPLTHSFTHSLAPRSE